MSRGPSSAELASERILIMTPFGRDGVMLARVLSAEGYGNMVCSDVHTLVDELKLGAGAILLTEEVLNSKESLVLLESLKNQESWSSIPVIAFYGRKTGADDLQKRARHPLQAFTDITFLERPVSTMTLLSATKAALKDRERQYQVRGLLSQLQADIVRREQQEILLTAAKQAAEAANQAKTQFLANMSHEIRTPLGAIIGFAELLHEGSTSLTEQKENLETVIRNGRQLAGLVNDLLDIAKVEAGRMEVESIDFHLADLILEVEKLFQPIAAQKNLKLELEFLPPIPQRVITDPTRLRQILVNLIGNALKFTEQGFVRLSIEKVDAHDSHQDFDLLFLVSDSGAGMSAKEQSRVFSSFVQGDSSTTRKFGGTGLGLALSRQLAQLLGGDLFIQSSHIGAGTTMALQIPSLYKVESKSNLAKTRHEHVSFLSSELADPGRLKGTRILLVEDTPDNQVLFTRILERQGALVHLASDGDEGVQMALLQEFDVILMDIQMPNKDGYEATRELRNQGYLGPVIALTAHAMREDREKTKEAGFTGFLTKPINKTDLIATLQSYRPEA